MLVSIIIVLFATSFNITYSIQYEKKSFLRQSALENDLIAHLVSVPLAFYDPEGIEQSLVHLQGHERIVMALVYFADKELAVSFNPNGEEIPDSLPPLGTVFEDEGLSPWEFGRLHSTMEIREDDQLLGYLHIEQRTDKITEFILNFIGMSTLFLIGLILFVYVVSLSLSKKILQPVLELAEVTKKVTETKDYSIRVPYKAKNEIGSLYEAFNTLLIHTESLTDNLEARVAYRTDELEKSMSALLEAQEQLIESEKMAALGNLVSGVAHEVNTPLGNALTGGSIIAHETKKLVEYIESGTIKKSTMIEGLRALNESAEILVLSIKRAADLIRSFKRISIDQSIEEKQWFNLYEYIDEIILTFQNKLKRVPIETRLEGEKELEVESYPGAYAQIISNFIQNSLLHGFETKKTDAKIIISLERDEQGFILRYKDNGEGMSKQMKKIAFEPFSTSKRNEGGTGLGLNIVYNIVTQKLGGRIELLSEKGEGVEYLIYLPYSHEH